MANALARNERLQFWNSFLRQRFLRFSNREKGLILLFIAAILVVWLTFFLGQQSKLRLALASAHTTAQTQRIVLDIADETEDSFRSLLADINLGAIPSRDEVNARIDAMLRPRFQDFITSPPRTTVGEDLSFHDFSINIRQADFENLVRFTDELKRTLPYVSLQRITIQAQRRDGRLLDVKLELKSIENTQ